MTSPEPPTRPAAYRLARRPKKSAHQTSSTTIYCCDEIGLEAENTEKDGSRMAAWEELRKEAEAAANRAEFMRYKPKVAGGFKSQPRPMTPPGATNLDGPDRHLSTNRPIM